MNALTTYLNEREFASVISAVAASVLLYVSVLMVVDPHTLVPTPRC